MRKHIFVYSNIYFNNNISNLSQSKLRALFCDFGTADIFVRFMRGREKKAFSSLTFFCPAARFAVVHPGLYGWQQVPSVLRHGVRPSAGWAVKSQLCCPLSHTPKRMTSQLADVSMWLNTHAKGRTREKNSQRIMIFLHSPNWPWNSPNGGVGDEKEKKNRNHHQVLYVRMCHGHSGVCEIRTMWRLNTKTIYSTFSTMLHISLGWCF